MTFLRPVTEKSHTVMDRSLDTDGAADKHIHHRWLAAQIPSITGLRLSPQTGDTSLVNISSSGILARVNTKLNPGTRVTLTFVGTFKPSSVAGRVVRCIVTDISASGNLWYHLGIAFDTPIDLRGFTPTENSQPTSAAPASNQPPGTLSNRW